MESIELGTGIYIFDYKNLSIDELYYLLHPSSKTQVPKLMEAIRSLKMVAIDDNSELSLYYKTDNKMKKLNDLFYSFLQVAAPTQKLGHLKCSIINIS